MDGMIFGLAAYRAGQQDPEITQMLNDIAWFFVEFPWQPFSKWLIASAIPILRARPGDAPLPRWAAYLCLVAAFLFAPAGIEAFGRSTRRSAVSEVLETSPR